MAKIEIEIKVKKRWWFHNILLPILIPFVEYMHRHHNLDMEKFCDFVIKYGFKLKTVVKNK